MGGSGAADAHAAAWRALQECWLPMEEQVVLPGVPRAVGQKGLCWPRATSAWHRPREPSPRLASALVARCIIDRLSLSEQLVNMLCACAVGVRNKPCVLV